MTAPGDGNEKVVQVNWQTLSAIVTTIVVFVSLLVSTASLYVRLVTTETELARLARKLDAYEAFQSRLTVIETKLVGIEKTLEKGFEIR